MRGVTLRCPYIYTIKKNKSVSYYFLSTTLLYKVVQYEIRADIRVGTMDTLEANIEAMERDLA